MRPAGFSGSILAALLVLWSTSDHGPSRVTPIRNIQPTIEANARYDDRLHRLILEFHVGDSNHAGNRIMAFAVGNMRRPTAARSPAQWMGRYGAFGNDSLIYWACVDTLTPPPPGYSPLNIWPSPYMIDPGDTLHRFQVFIRTPPPIVHYYAWGYDSLVAPGQPDPLTLGNAVTGEIAIQDVLSGDRPAGLPSRVELREPVPNPATASTSIGFGLPRDAGVRLMVYDVRGARVRELVNGRREGGIHVVVWDTCRDNGQRCAAGMYSASLIVDGQRIESRAITILR